MSDYFDPTLDAEVNGLLDGLEGGVDDEDEDVAGIALDALSDPDLGSKVSPATRQRIVLQRRVLSAAVSSQLSRQGRFGLYPNYVVTLLTTHTGAGELTSSPVELRPVGAGRGDAKRRLTLIQIQTTLGSAATVAPGAFLKDIQVNDEPTFPTVGAANPIPFELFMPSSYQSPFIYPISLSAVNFRSGDSVTATHIAPGAGIYQTSLYFVTDYTVRCGRGRTPSAVSGPSRMAAMRILASVGIKRR